MSELMPVPASILKAFVGRSFHDDDKPVWEEIRDMLGALRPLGLVCEDAEAAQARPVSEKVKAGIARNDIYIAILTRRHPIARIRLDASLFDRAKFLFAGGGPANQFSTSEWVIEEIGYAIGRERPVVVLIEEGVLFPGSDLDADMEWIRFVRGNILKCQTKLTHMLNGLLADRLTPVALASTATPPTAVAEPGEAPSTEPAEVTSEEATTDTFDQILSLAKAGVRRRGGFTTKVAPRLGEQRRKQVPGPGPLTEDAGK